MTQSSSDAGMHRCSECRWRASVRIEPTRGGVKFFCLAHLPRILSETSVYRVTYLKSVVIQEKTHA